MIEAARDDSGACPVGEWRLRNLNGSDCLSSASCVGVYLRSAEPHLPRELLVCSVDYTVEGTNVVVSKEFTVEVVRLDCSAEGYGMACQILGQRCWLKHR
jgi:hypothetical protein